MNTELAMLIVTILSLLVTGISVMCTFLSDRKLLRTTLILDYSRRYQEIMLSMPDDDTNIEKYVLLYIDLCSEEYRLHKRGGIVDTTTWHLWQDGMRSFLQNERYRRIWQQNREYYSTDDFPRFFDSLITPS